MDVQTPRDTQASTSRLSRLYFVMAIAVPVLTGWLGVAAFVNLKNEAIANADLLEELVTMQASSDPAVSYTNKPSATADGRGSLATEQIPDSISARAVARPPEPEPMRFRSDRPAPGETAGQEEQPGAAALNGDSASATAGIDPIFVSPIFTREVRYWEPQILAWAGQYDLDPDIVATIMQIESCGDPAARSSAGAQGLFQVMPHHFTVGENMFDPDINAEHGLTYFREGLQVSNGDVFRAFAGYNAGHDIVVLDRSSWPVETQQYYYWSTGIYAEAKAGSAVSQTLEEWMRAGGAGLCRQAAIRLGLPLSSEPSR